MRWSRMFLGTQDLCISTLYLRFGRYRSKLLKSSDRGWRNLKSQHGMRGGMPCFFIGNVGRRYRTEVYKATCISFSRSARARYFCFTES